MLLKNEGGFLPLSRSVQQNRGHRPFGRRSDCAAGKLQRHLVQAGDSAGRNRAAVPDCASAVRARRDLHGQHSRAGSSTFLTPPDGNGRGLLAEYFDNPDLQGQPKLRRTEPRAYFDMGMEDPAVVAAIGHEKYSVRWTGTLTPPATGEYDLTFAPACGIAPQGRLFLDDKELAFGDQVLPLK